MSYIKTDLQTFQPIAEALIHSESSDPVAQKIDLDKLYENQQTVIGFGSFQGIEFIRLVPINVNDTEEDILNLFIVIERYVSQHLELPITS